MTPNIKKGCLAIVKMGRGRGEVVLVLQECGEDRVLVANGRSIRAEKPKIKNPKHLEPLGQPIEMEDEVLRGNMHLRKWIRERFTGIIEQEGLFCQRMM